MSGAGLHASGTLLSALALAAEQVVERLSRSLVTIRGHDSGAGAGIVWSDGGLIVTNSHVLGGDHAEVIDHDGTSYQGRLVARDPRHDLAALRVDAKLPPVSIGDSARLRVGQLVLAAGHPWGQREAVTAGIILSVTGGGTEHGAPLAGVIRADVRLAPGNSGGPLADARGDVIGINTMIAGGEAIAVPSNTASRFVEEEAGDRGVLGVVAVAAPLPHAIAAALPGAPDAALILTEVTTGSAAELAGLLPGDVLLAVDGVSGDIHSVAGALRRLRSHQPVQLELLRGGRRLVLLATPVQRSMGATA